MLRISLFGEFSIKVNDRLIQISSSRLHSLLAYLFLKKDRLHSRVYLAGLFWPDTSETQARTNLRNLLYQLRQSLPNVEEYFHLDSQNITVIADAPISLDVDDFTSALNKGDSALEIGEKEVAQQVWEDAVAMYVGDLFPSCYDEWIIPEREYLRQDYLNGLEKLSNLFEDHRDYDSAIHYAQRLLQQDPLREATYRRLMRLYAINGDRATAMRVFHTCATTLQRELGVGPGSTTQQDYEQLLGVASEPEQSTPVPSTFSTLVGREKEWTILLNTWQTAKTGKNPHMVMLRGEAGIGKTRLLDELDQWATRQGISIATAHCYAVEGELAYSPVVAWLRARPLPPVDDIWLSEAAHVLPEILIDRSDLPRPSPLKDPWQREHLFEALARLLLSNNQPTLLEIDDLQWCDQDTLEFLHFLLRFQEQPRFLIVGAYRPEEVQSNHPLISLLNMLRIEEQVLEIDLQSLDETRTHILITQLTKKEIDPGISQRIFQDTEGNPLFVVETIRAMLPIIKEPLPGIFGFDTALENQGLPPKVHSILNARLAQLSSSSRELAESAAVIGREFNFSLLQEVSGRNEEALVRELDELWRKQVVREHGKDSYDFSHDKLREVAYKGMSLTKRRLLHKRAAQALEKISAQNSESVAHQVAIHYEQAGMIEKALPHFLVAARCAHNVFSNDEAINIVQHGFVLFDDPKNYQEEIPKNLELEFLELLADIYEIKMDHSSSLEVLNKALNRTKHDDIIRRARLWRKIGSVKREQRLYPEALRTYQLAEKALGDQMYEVDPQWWNEWLENKVEQVWAHYWLAEWPEMNALVNQLNPIIQRHSNPTSRMRFLMAFCLLYLRKDRYVVSEEMLHHSHEALKLSQNIARLKTKMECHFEYGFLNLWRRNLAEAEKYLAIALKIAEKTEILPYQTLCLTYLSILKRFQDDIEGVRGFSTRARDLATLTQMPDYIAASYGNDAWIAWRKSNLDQTRELSDKAIEIWEKSPLVYPFQWIALWPRLGGAFAEKNEAEIWYSIQKMLEPTQQIFPEEVDVALHAAMSAQKNVQEGESDFLLDQAIKSAKKMGYL